MYYYCRQPVNVGGRGKKDWIFALGVTAQDSERLFRDWEARGARMDRPSARDRRPHVGFRPNGARKKPLGLQVKIPMEYRSLIMDLPSFCGVPKDLFELLRTTQRLEYAMRSVDPTLRDECRSYYVRKIRRQFYQCLREGAWMETNGGGLETEDEGILILQSMLREKFDLVRPSDLSRRVGRPPKVEMEDYQWSTPRDKDGNFLFTRLEGE